MWTELTNDSHDSTYQLTTDSHDSTYQPTTDSHDSTYQPTIDSHDSTYCEHNAASAVMQYGMFNQYYINL